MSRAYYYDLRAALVFRYRLKKTAAKSNLMLFEAFSEHALVKHTLSGSLKNSKVLI